MRMPLIANMLIFIISNSQISIYSHISVTPMPKIKTHKATAKRFTITKTKKIKRRKAGQDHFNARESGTVTRRKRRDVNAHKSHVKTIKTLIPYS